MYVYVCACVCVCVCVCGHVCSVRAHVHIYNITCIIYNTICVCACVRADVYTGMCVCACASKGGARKEHGQVRSAGGERASEECKRSVRGARTGLGLGSRVREIQTLVESNAQICFK